MEQLVYLNGELITRSRAAISPYDCGFLYGYALFETMRSYSGRIFRLSQHLQRLSESAEEIGIPVDRTVLEGACEEVLKGNGLADARIRLTVSPGEGNGLPDPPTEPVLTIFAVAMAFIPLPPEKYNAGFKAIVSSLRRNSLSPLSRMKSANYLESIMARAEAKKRGADEALLLNERELLCEGSTSNIFFLKDGKLVTPSIESGCLPGITRNTVLELAESLHIPAEQRNVAPEELIRSDEAFLTNSVMEIVPLTYIDNKQIGSGRKGEVTSSLIKAYKELVAAESSSLP
jgi:branched-chain amino acid aminotransferase